MLKPLEWEGMVPPDSLPDDRLRERLIQMGRAREKQPGLPYSATFKHRKDRQGAYRLVENDRLTFDTVLAGAKSATGGQVRESGESTVLCVQDSSEIDQTHHPKARGFGTTGNPECRGEFLHLGLAVGVDGVPLGVLAAMTWVRPPSQRGKARHRRQRPFSRKESYRWWKTITLAEEAVARPGVLLHVGDRESDIHDVLRRAVPAGIRVLLRARHDRRVRGGQKKLWATCESWPELGTRELDVPERREGPHRALRRARRACLSMRAGTIQLPASGGSRQPLSINAVLARELEPPPDEDPVEWLLLTTEPVHTSALAWRVVDLYRLRWTVEDYFKCLKTGCKVEERQYAERRHFDVALALDLLVAVRILGLSRLARSEPDARVERVLESSEVEVLARTMERPVRTVGEAVAAIAELGGHMGRRGDGPPGWLTLWRGYRRLSDLVDGYRLAKPRLHDNPC